MQPRNQPCLVFARHVKEFHFCLNKLVLFLWQVLWYLQWTSEALLEWLFGFSCQLPHQGPSCPFAQFGHTTNSSKLLLFDNYWGHWSTGNTQNFRHGFTPSPWPVPHNNFIRGLQSSSELHGLVFVLTCSVGPYIHYSAFFKLCVIFDTSQRKRKIIIWSVTAKSLNTFINERIYFLNISKFAKPSRSVFFTLS